MLKSTIKYTFYLYLDNINLTLNIVQSQLFTLST